MRLSKNLKISLNWYDSLKIFLGLLQSAIRNAANGGPFCVTLQSYMTIIIESQIQKVIFLVKIKIFLHLYDDTVIFL